jgi:hypothetical protein
VPKRAPSRQLGVGSDRASMIKYQLYDKYGIKVHEHSEEAEDCGTIILKHDSQYYRPVHYDLISEPHVAKCIPVEVIDCRGQ